MTAFRRVLANDIAMISVTAGLYLTVIILALSPSSFVPHLIGLSDKVEHGLAFLVLGFLTAGTAPASVGVLRLALPVVAFAAGLELSQFVSPTRSVDCADFVASATGAIIGISIRVGARRWTGQAMVPWRSGMTFASNASRRSHTIIPA
jgi:VanZ family protein